MAAARGSFKPSYNLWVANKPAQGNYTVPLYDKYTGKIATHVSGADDATIKGAIGRGVQAEPLMAKMPSFQRKQILMQIAGDLQKRQEELAQILTVEVGKPIKDARVEVSRAVDTFTLAAEEATRREGDYQLLDISQRNQAHKIAPAIAAGCPFVLKPSERTPLSALVLGEILAGTQLPEGAFSILPCDVKYAPNFSEDERIKLLSFTGSVSVGWKLKSTAGKKKVTLELGGNAACVIDEDTKNLDAVAERVAFGAFYQSGQSCISVQRIYVHEKIYDEFKRLFVEKAKKYKAGDPMDTATLMGPLISEDEAKRVEAWVSSAKGALLCGGKRNGSFFDATVMEDVSKKSDLYCKEVFGPVAMLDRFSDFKEVVDKVNNSAYGLQTGVYTQNIHKAFYAFQNLHVGGVVINDVPSARVDSQPYGGVKDSGVGREGVKYAFEDFTEIKVMLMKDIGVL